MKKVVIVDAAIAALTKHRNMASRILDKLEAYAENPASRANQVKALRGVKAKRLRVGDFRVIFEETETEIIVTDVGPRGSVYK